MNIDDIKPGMCRYVLKTFTLSIPGSKPYDLDISFVGDMLIERDYDNSYFSLFITTITVPNWVARAMRAANDGVMAFISMQYGLFEEISSESLPTWGLVNYINDNFLVFFEDNSPSLTSADEERYEKEAGLYQEGSTSSEQSMIKIALYNAKYLKGAKEPVNTILTQSNIADAVTFVLNKAGISKVLMTPPTSFTSYKELVLTPISALEQLERLTQEYVLHNKGTTVFFDLNTCYILERAPQCSAFIPGEYKTTYIASINETDSRLGKVSGCYSNSKEKYNLCLILGNSITVSTESMINDQLIGNDVVAIDSTTGEVVTSISGAKNSSALTTSKPNRTILAPSGSFNTIKALIHSNKESSKVVSVGLDYINFKMLDPNKEFILTMDSAKYKAYSGKYRITKMTATLKKDGGYYHPSAVCEFRG